MTKNCTCKTLAMVAGGVAMVAASASGEGTGLSATYSGSEEVIKPTGTTTNEFVARTGGTAGDICALATNLPCNSSFAYDNSKTSGGWDIIDLNIPAENYCLGNALEPDRNTYWFSFVASDTSAQVHTCSSQGTDSSMQAYEGTCAGLTEIGCAEDNCGATTFNSYIYLEGLSVGTTYYVQVGSWDGAAAGSYQIDLVCPADHCAACPTGGVPEIDTVGPNGAGSALDFVQSGDPLDTPSVPAGGNLNYGCVEPDLGVGIGGTENDPVRIQDLGSLSTGVPLTVCGEVFRSYRSDAPPTSRFLDYDWYEFGTPVNAVNGAVETVNYEFYANGQRAVFFLQLGNDNGRGCDGDTIADPDIYFAAFAYYPYRTNDGGVGDCNVHNTNSIALEDGETYNIVIRNTRFDDGPEGDTDDDGVLDNPIGQRYTLTIVADDPPTGACCETDDTCTDGVAQSICFGIYRGDNSMCSSLPVGSECPLPLPCPAGGNVENAGAGEVIGGDDTINVGCNADPDPVTGVVVPIAPDILDCAVPTTLTWCGTTGNFMGNTRDLDWYRLTLPTDAQVVMTVQAQVPMQAFLVETFDGNFIECDGETVVGFEQSTVKDGTIIVDETLCAGDYYVIPATNSFTEFQIKPNVPSDTGWDYIMTVVCNPVLQEVGACCLKDATCIETDPCNCGDLGGLYYGEDSQCSDAQVICCLPKCDGSETQENEDADGNGNNCVDGYHDLYNGGCDADDHEGWQTGDYIYTGDTVGTGTVAVDPFLDTVLDQVWCGRVGQFFTNLRLDDGTVQANEDVRDTDWYRIEHTGGDLFATACPDQFFCQVILFEELQPTGALAAICDTVKFADTDIDAAARRTQNVASLTVDPCTVEALNFGAQPAGRKYLVVAAVNTVFGNDFSCVQGKEYQFSYGDTSCTPCSNVDGSADGLVNLGDLNTVLFSFGQTVPPGTNGDTDCDGDVDLQDLNQVLFDFGTNVGC